MSMSNGSPSTTDLPQNLRVSRQNVLNAVQDLKRFAQRRDLKRGQDPTEALIEETGHHLTVKCLESILKHLDNVTKGMANEDRQDKLR